jgi:hypothetical protein
MFLVIGLIFSLAVVRFDFRALVLQPRVFCLLYLYILVQLEYCAADWECKVKVKQSRYRPGVA